jgi:hypothetical protein
MKGRFLLIFAFVGMAFAATKTYTVNLMENATIGNTEMKAGSYRIEVNDQTAVIRQGKTSAEVPVKVEKADSKYMQTSVKYSTEGGKYRVEEIHVGGTNTKLVLGDRVGAASGQ